MYSVLSRNMVRVIFQTFSLSFKDKFQHSIQDNSTTHKVLMVRI
jgi:hypothetical protein